MAISNLNSLSFSGCQGSDQIRRFQMEPRSPVLLQVPRHSTGATLGLSPVLAWCGGSSGRLDL
jgi:hypothetical protein